MYANIVKEKKGKKTNNNNNKYYDKISQTTSNMYLTLNGENSTKQTNKHTMTIQ